MAGTINENDMYTLLSQVFKPEVANTLLQQLKGDTKPAPIVDRVMPGDLITAELMNQVLVHLANLETRVADLETGSVGTLHIFRIDGPKPTRVGSRVTAIGENFSEPGTRNVVLVNTEPATPINNASSATQLVFDLPDPGIGQTGKKVMLKVTNADGQTASLQFQLEPALIIPTGTLRVKYITPPAGSANLNAGTYDFGFKLTADVDQNAYIQLSANTSDATWTSILVDPHGITDYTKPIPLLQAPGTTHFELEFIVRVIAPSSGSTVINVGATEVTDGTHVNPAPLQPLSLAINHVIPVPENRVSVNFLSTSSNVTFEGGTAVFTRNTLGRIDLEILFNNLGTAGGVESTFTPTFELMPNSGNNWEKGLQTGTEITIPGPEGKGTTGLRLTPPNVASDVVLLLKISGQPPGGTPVDVTYNIPLRTN